MADYWVEIRHPDLPDAPTSVVSRKAFDDVWKAKGFVDVNAPKPKKKTTKKKSTS